MKKNKENSVADNVKLLRTALKGSGKPVSEYVKIYQLRKGKNFSFPKIEANTGINRETARKRFIQIEKMLATK